MTVVITGANRGIGRAMFDGYVARNDAVIGTSRRPLDPFIHLDVTTPSSHKEFAEKLKAQPIELLVCNAGIYPDKTEGLEDGYPEDMWASAFATNVAGVFMTVQALLPNIIAAKGKIAIISSQMASHTRAPGGSYIYRASKAAALNLGRNLATDLKPRGVAVGIYHPGWVRTDMGGADGEIDVGEARDGLMARFDALSIQTTGCFETWDGRAHPY